MCLKPRFYGIHTQQRLISVQCIHIHHSSITLPHVHPSSITLPRTTLKSTLILKFQSTKDSEKTINCSIDGFELFSCSLSNEDETALSILDPVSVSVDVKPSGHQEETPRSKQTTNESLTGSAQILEVRIKSCYCFKVMWLWTSYLFLCLCFPIG